MRKLQGKMLWTKDEKGGILILRLNMEEMDMGKKIAGILRGELTSSVFYVLLGLCLVLMPAQTVNIICKVVFGIVLIGAGAYHIFIYIRGKDTSTILDLFTGAIVLVLGGFLFFNPLIVVKLLPLLLGAFILVDSIWTLRGSFQLKKRGRAQWQAFLFTSLIFIVLGGLLIMNPFMKTKTTVLFAGWLLLINGAVDLVFYALLKRGLKEEPAVKEKSGEEEKGKGSSTENTVSGEQAENSEGEAVIEKGYENIEEASKEQTYEKEEEEVLEEWKD